MKSIHNSSYDRPLILCYTFSQITFTANRTDTIEVPRFPAGAAIAGNTAPGANAGRGWGGRVLGGQVKRITTDFAGSTSDSGVRVGDGTTAGKYFDSGLNIDETVDATESMYLVDTGSQVDIEDGRRTVVVTFVASVGTPAGVADIDLWIAWWMGRTI